MRLFTKARSSSFFEPRTTPKTPATPRRATTDRRKTGFFEDDIHIMPPLWLDKRRMRTALHAKRIQAAVMNNAYILAERSFILAVQPEKRKNIGRWLLIHFASPIAFFIRYRKSNEGYITTFRFLSHISVHGGRVCSRMSFCAIAVSLPGRGLILRCGGSA